MERVVSLTVVVLTVITLLGISIVEVKWNRLEAEIQELRSENSDLRLTILNLNETLERQERLFQKRLKP
jgi:FtsZ-binding cell division protein ZapB